MDVFGELYLKNRSFVRKTLSYYGLSSEEVRHECMTVYFLNPEIRSLWDSGEKNRASSLFISRLQSQSTIYSQHSMITTTNKQFKRDRRLVDKMEVQVEYDDENRTSDFEMVELYAIIEEMKKKCGYDDVQFLMDYLDLGSNYLAFKLKIPVGTVRARAHRIKEKIKAIMKG